MAKYKPEKELDTGWTEWIRPSRPVYSLACCDCGLVHDMEFTTDNDGSPMFRARRNEKDTKKLRRKKNGPSE